MSFEIEKETIPNASSLYMRVHINMLKPKDRNYSLNDRVPFNIFKEHNGSMSVDWKKYSTAEATRERTNKPHENGVIKMNTGAVRNIPPLEVEHSPKPKNHAHTDVIGVEQRDAISGNEIRLKLSRISQWCLRPLEK